MSPHPSSEGTDSLTTREGEGMDASRDLSPAASGVALPAPRLQLRWEPNLGKQRFAAGEAWAVELMKMPPRPPTPEWLCNYELVLPLGEHDVRREGYGPRGGRRPDLDRTELVVPLKKPTVRASTAVPCVLTNTGERYADTPFRDGAHAKWDSRLLGGLPVFVVAPDGEALPVADTSSPNDPLREASEPNPTRPTS